MNKNQTIHYKMYLTTQSHMDNYTPLWQNIPRAVNYKNEMDELISRIAEKAISYFVHNFKATKTQSN